VGTRAVEMSNILTLKKAKMKVDGTFDEYNAGSIALVRLSGNCVASPNSAWAATDKFSTTIAYTFAPVAVQTYTVTKGTADKVGNNVNAVTSWEISPSNAAEGDTVTVNFVADNKADKIDITVKGADGNAIDDLGATNLAVDQTDKDGTHTFTMPAQNVTVDIKSHA